MIFSEEVLKEINDILRIEQVDVRFVRDGVINKMENVWWRNNNGPEFVATGTHWLNITNFPHLYQINKPSVRSVIDYID